MRMSGSLLFSSIQLLFQLYYFSIQLPFKHYYFDLSSFHFSHTIFTYPAPFKQYRFRNVDFSTTSLLIITFNNDLHSKFFVEEIEYTMYCYKITEINFGR